MPLAILAVYVGAMSVAPPLINLALRLERRLLIRGDSLAVTYARMHLQPSASTFPVSKILMMKKYVTWT